MSATKCCDRCGKEVPLKEIIIHNNGTSYSWICKDCNQRKGKVSKADPIKVLESVIKKRDKALRKLNRGSKKFHVT